MSRATYTAKQFIDAIPGTGGIITTIAQRVGCAWHTAKKHIDAYPTIQTAYADELNKNLDIAEAIIIDNLKLLRKEQEQTREPVETSDARWLLATKGRGRGYVQKTETEVTGKDGGAIEIADARVRFTSLINRIADTRAEGNISEGSE